MIKDLDIYWIGGSPCSGKSTMSELLVKDFGFTLYKCDDFLDRFIEIGVGQEEEIMMKFHAMTMDEIWLRCVDQQVTDELEFYRVALKIIENDLLKDYQGKKIIIEGAAILPEFIIKSGINKNRYICMVPTSDFQNTMYRKREWVKGYLKPCSDPKQAFLNWMERDEKFALTVKKQAEKHGLNVIQVDGSLSIDETYAMVKTMFQLDDDKKVNQI